MGLGLDGSKRKRYQTRAPELIAVNGAFPLEPAQGAKVMGGPGYLTKLYAPVVARTDSNTPFYIMVFDIQDALDITASPVPLPLLVAQCDIGTAFEYEPPLETASLYERVQDPSTAERGPLGYRRLYIEEFKGLEFFKGIRVVASSSQSVLAPVADVFYVSDAEFISLGGC